MKDNQLYILKRKNNDGNTLVTAFQKDRDPFKVMGQGLYAWVYRRAYDNMLEEARRVGGDIEEVTGQIKFGQYGANAASGSFPHETIDSYVGTTTDEIVILWAKRLSDKEIEANGSALQVEQVVNKRIGLKNDKGRSTEVFNTKISTIKTETNNVLYGISKKESYKPRPPQQECIDRMVYAYINGEKKFLIGALPRFGKNFVFLQFVTFVARIIPIVYSEGENILIITNKPGVFPSLIDDINNHVDFDNMEIIFLKEESDKKNVILNPNKVSIVMCSKQLADNIVSGDRVKSFLRSVEWCTAFIDECHSGTDTDKFKELIDSLKIRFQVFASGTPFKTNATGNFTAKNSYFYGYIEQQKDKRAGLIDDAVTLVTYVPQIDPNILANSAYTADEGFNFSKFLGNVKSHAGDIRKFFSDLFDLSPTKAKFSATRICKEVIDFNHVVVNIPAGVEMAEQLTELLTELFAKDGRKIINATGGNITDINKAKDIIARNEKTMTLTYNRFIEGTTVPEWNAAFIMSDTTSVEKYFQFIFRTASPAKGKDVAVVFDMNPERQLKMVFEMAMATAVNNDEVNIREVIASWLDCMNIFHTGGGQNGAELVEVDVEDVLNVIRNAGADYTCARLLKTADDYVNLDKATKELAEMLSGVAASKEICITTQIVTNNIEKARTMTRTSDIPKTETEKVKHSDLVLFMNRIAVVVSTLPYVSFMMGETSIEGIIKSVDPDADLAFLDTTSVDRSIFRKIVEAGIIDTRKINVFL